MCVCVCVKAAPIIHVHPPPPSVCQGVQMAPFVYGHWVSRDASTPSACTREGFGLWQLTRHLKQSTPEGETGRSMPPISSRVSVRVYRCMCVHLFTHLHACSSIAVVR